MLISPKMLFLRGCWWVFLLFVIFFSISLKIMHQQHISNMSLFGDMLLSQDTIVNDVSEYASLF